MFTPIFLYEFKYRLRRPATYIYFLLMVGIGLLYGSIMGGGFGPEPAGMITQGGKNLANSPYNLHTLIVGVGQIGIFVVAAIMGVPVFRDYRNNIHQLFFTKPITKAGYLGGRFLGSLLISMVVLLGVGIGMWIASQMPYVDAEKYGPNHLIYYLNPYLIGVFPFVVFTGSIFFATVTLTRNQLFIYLNAIVILVLLSVASYLANEVENKTLASLLDPTGGAALANETEYWTVAERNTQTIPFSPLILANLVIWQFVALAILAFTFFKFRFSYDAGEARFFVSKTASTIKQIGDTVTLHRVQLPQVGKDFSFRNQLSLLGQLTWREIRGVVSSPIFIAIASVGVLLMLTVVAFSGLIFETPTYPVTYRILDTLSGQFALFILIIIVFYSGEMVWAERGIKVNQIYDALPIPNWLTYLAKLLAMFGIIYLLMAVVMVCGILVQTFQGYFHYELGLYVETLFFFEIIDFLLFAVLAFFVQVMVNNKYLGFFLVVLLFFGFNMLLPGLGVEHKLFRYMSDTGLVYSDMNGYGHYVKPFLLFKVYWGGFALILATLSYMFWVRGVESNWKIRFRKARQQLSPGTAVALLIGFVLFAGGGGLIYYNTNVLNDYRTSKEQQKALAEFEKKYSRYENAPQPRITAVNLNVDLFPQDRRFSATGSYVLKNKTAVNIDSIHLNVNQEIDYQEMRFDRSFERVYADEEMGYYIFRLDAALAPGDSVLFFFEEELAIQGFPNSGSNTQLVYNGTFLNHGYFPGIGYDPVTELQDEDLRKKYDLPEKERYPSIDDTVGVKNALFARDADWVDFECTVSTSPDQIAVVPGYLQREWEENGRRYFHYKMDSKMAKFYNIVSARYEVMRDSWTSPQGEELKLEIYYHPGHTYNLDRMMKGMKESLSYYSQNFGPYQHRQLRILEFPRYMGFAQSFANTVPFSEAIGFIAKVEEGDVDYPFYVTAHEVAHQWWAHQVAGGMVQGFQFLSETMSQYAALMVMEEEFGQKEISKYLKLEIDNYLKRRTAERRKELPALLSENQMYIHYNKGSVIMYALQDYIGEDSLNAAMKRYVDAVRFQNPPYTTTREWLSYVEAVTPDSLRYLLTDLFENITLYDVKVKEATYTEIDSQYLVKIEIEAHKYRDDGKGEETAMPLQDYLDVGVFARQKVDGKWEDHPLYLEKHLITDSLTVFEITVDQEPDKVGIDPYYKMIDRKLGDNMERVEAQEPGK